MNGLSLGCVNTRRASLDRVLLLYVFHLLTFGEQELTPSRRAQSSSFDSLLFLQDLLSISLFLFHSFSWVQQSSSFNFLSVSVLLPQLHPPPILSYYHHQSQSTGPRRQGLARSAFSGSAQKMLFLFILKFISETAPSSGP